MMLSSRDTLRQAWLPAFLLVLVILAVWHPDTAHAASSGGGSLPWDTPLTTLKNDLTGPVAFTIYTMRFTASAMRARIGARLTSAISCSRRCSPARA